MNIIVGIVFILLLSFAYGSLRGAPWVPTKKHDVQRFLNLAEVKENEIFYELGCGDARITCAAGNAGAKATGFDVSLFPFIIAQIRVLFSKNRKNINIKYRDIWFLNFKDADLVYMFLMPETYEKIKPKLEKELKPGARVITYVWPMPGWEAKTIDKIEGYPPMYLYQR